MEEGNQEKKKRADTKNEAYKLRVITLQGATGKRPILLSQYWKHEWLDSTIII